MDTYNLRSRTIKKRPIVMNKTRIRSRLPNDDDNKCVIRPALATTTAATAATAVSTTTAAAAATSATTAVATTSEAATTAVSATSATTVPAIAAKMIRADWCPAFSVPTPEDYECNRKRWIRLAEAALQHYNSKQNTNYKLFELKGNRANSNYIPTIHINCTAKPEDDPDSPPKLFYGELKATPFEVKQVIGCCIMKKIGEGDPKAGSCYVCGDHINHPSARYGYCIESGDRVGDYFKPPVYFFD